MATRPAPDLASTLLTYLRRSLANDTLSYAESPSQITGGYETTVYSFQLLGARDEWAGPLILRVFRFDSALTQPRFERAAQNAVASLGYPAPRVLLMHEEHEPLGGAFLIMERLPGRIMLELFFRPNRKWLALARIMAELHARLHALEADAFATALENDRFSRDRVSAKADVEQMERQFERLSLDGLLPGLRWVKAHQPRPSERVAICHGDYHPLNILMDRGDVTGVIDWSWASLGDAAYDVGATVAIFSHGPVDLPGFARGVVGFFRRRFIADYLRAYQKHRPLDLDAVRYYEALRCLGFLAEGSEHRLADAGLAERPIKLSAFTAPYVLQSIVRRFDQITGVKVDLPRAAPVGKEL